MPAASGRNRGMPVLAVKRMYAREGAPHNNTARTIRRMLPRLPVWIRGRRFPHARRESPEVETRAGADLALRPARGPQVSDGSAIEEQHDLFSGRVRHDATELLIHSVETPAGFADGNRG